MLPPPLTDWWTAVDSSDLPARGMHRQGPGGALLVRAATRLLSLLPD